MATGASAQPAGVAAGGGAFNPIKVSLRTGAGHQFDTDLSGGGDVSVSRFIIAPSMLYIVNKDLSLSGSFTYGRETFDFSGAAGSTGLASLNPFEGVNSTDLGFGARYRIADQWTLTGGGTLRSYWEDDADFDDGFHVGGYAGFSYKFNDRFTIGPAIGVSEQLEDDVDIIPILLINWKITDELTLRTGRGLGATRGPGLELVYAFNQHWEIGVAGRYDKMRFRLGGSAPAGAANGVGQNRSWSALGVIRYKPSPTISINGVGGMIFDGDMRIEDSSGNKLVTSDYDATPFVGLVAEFRF